MLVQSNPGTDISTLNGLEHLMGIHQAIICKCCASSLNTDRYWEEYLFVYLLPEKNLVDHSTQIKRITFLSTAAISYRCIIYFFNAEEGM